MKNQKSLRKEYIVEYRYMGITLITRTIFLSDEDLVDYMQHNFMDNINIIDFNFAKNGIEHNYNEAIYEFSIKYLFDFIYLNLENLKEIKIEFDEKIKKAIILFSNNFELLYTDYFDVYTEDIECTNYEEHSRTLISIPTFYVDLQHYFHKDNLDELDSKACEMSIKLLADYLAIFGLKEEDCLFETDLSSVMVEIKNVANELKKIAINDFSYKDEKHSYEITLYRDKIWILETNLKIYTYITLMKKENSKNLEERRYWLEKYNEIYCDELYSMLTETLKLNIFEIKLPLSFSFLQTIIFPNIWKSLRMLYVFKDKDYYNLYHNKKTRKQIMKFYYLSVFFKNCIANSLDNEYTFMELNDIEYDEDYIPFNSFAGFSKNIKMLTKVKNKNISKNLICDIKYDDCAKDTQIESHKILETALFNKAMMDNYPIYTGMEYTPIMVNLFKAVEELSCDLLEKLDIPRINNIEKIKGFYIEDFHFDEDWQDNITLGSLFKLIKSINLNDKTFNGQMINNSYKGMYDDRYQQYFESRLASINKFIENNLEMLKKNNDDNVSSKLNECEKPSDILFETLSLWRIRCRNNCVHKDDTLNKERVNFTFEFTYLVIAMLIEWYWCLKN